MTQQSIKICSTCQHPAALNTPTCLDCGHRFRLPNPQPVLAPIPSQLLPPSTVHGKQAVKVRKRLVSKEEYAWRMAGTTTLLSVSAVGFSVAMLFTVATLFLLFAPDIGLAVMCALIGGFVWYLTYFFYQTERKLERVAPITRRTTSSLPPEESLLRAADLPPSQYRAELLRAAGQSPETPTEHLLRATTKNGI